MEIDSEWAAVAVLRRGTYSSDHHSTMCFTVPNMSDEEARDAMKHLRWSGSENGLLYERDHRLTLVDTEPPLAKPRSYSWSPRN